MKSVGIQISLLCLSSGVFAQEAEDLTSLTFTPGPMIDLVLAPLPHRDERDGSTDARSTDERRDGLLETVATLEHSLQAQDAEGGNRSSALIATLTTLAAAHQDLGNHIEAIAALGEARQILRINDGLYSLDQAAIVEQIIDSLEALGQYDESDSLQDSLLELALKNEGDARVPPILTAVANRQMAAVKRYVEDGVWSRSREPLNAFKGSGWEPNTPEVGRHLAAGKLAEMRNRFDGGIEAALESDEYEIGDALELGAKPDELYALIDSVNDCAEEGRNPPGVPFACMPEVKRMTPMLPLTDKELALAALRRARRLGSAAVQATLAAGNGATGEFRAVEEQLKGIYYFEMAHAELYPSYVYKRDPRRRSLGEMIYATGAAVLEAAVVDRMSTTASPVDVATALVELGDWHLLFSANRTALEKYQAAYDLLVEKAEADAANAFFAPEVPVMLPAFASDARHFDPAHRYRGYIDVSVEIGRYGDGTAVDVLDVSPGTSRAVERRLRRHVLETRFRPRFVDGEPARSDASALRYYFEY